MAERTGGGNRADDRRLLGGTRGNLRGLTPSSWMVAGHFVAGTGCPNRAPGLILNRLGFGFMRLGRER